jgi:hypothetical protein
MRWTVPEGKRRRQGFSAPGHGAKEQSGPVRPTVVPSGQILASRWQLVGPAGGDAHGGNVQSGPERETDDPSGQTLASAGQRFGPAGSGAAPPQATTKRSSRVEAFVMAIPLRPNLGQ